MARSLLGWLWLTGCSRAALTPGFATLLLPQVDVRHGRVA